MELQYFRDGIKILMKEKRYQHSLGVEEVAYDLALIYGYSTEKASVAGILHDCAKELTEEEMLRECEKYHLPVTEVERKNTALLHAKVGAVWAEDKFGIEEEDILNSIKYHTTGRPAMTLLEKILFIADFIEPNREPLPNIDSIRHTAYENLDLAVIMVSKSTMDYLKKTGAPFDTLTKETYEYYKEHLYAQTHA